MPPTWPRNYQSFIVVACASLLALGWAEARVRSVAHAQAVDEIAKDREAFKADAIHAAEVAAREGAERAVRDTVNPWIVEQAKHKAADEQAQKDTERRLDVLERRAR